MFNFSAKTFIVDDDPIFLKMLELELREGGVHDLQSFTNADTGLAAMSQRPDFVVLDFSLGGFNGLDILKKTKKLLPTSEVVVLTSLKNEQLEKECIANGAAEYLNKGDKGSVSRILARIDAIAQKKKTKTLTAVGVGVAILLALVAWLVFFS